MKDALLSKKYRKKQKRLFKELQNAEYDEPGNGDVWESVDMKKPLHPIGYYINNREEMIRQVFTVIHGERLKKMLPPVLKDIDLDELKADCLIHLVGMSSKRIKAILEGCELDVSSDESDSDVSSAINSNNFSSLGSASVSNSNDLMVMQQKKLKPSSKSTTGVNHSNNNSSQILEDGCSIISGDDMLEIGLTNSDLCDDFFESNDDSKSPKNKRKKLKRSNQPSQQTLAPVVASTAHTGSQQSDSADADLSVKGDNDKIKVDGDENRDTKGKTLLEILELEMRARAIRALLKRDDSPTESLLLSSQQKQKQCNSDTIIATQSEIIDLTMAHDSAELVTATTKVSVKEVMQIKKTENVGDNEDNIKEKDKCSETKDNSVMNKIRNTEENAQSFKIDDNGEDSDKPVSNDKVDDNDKNIACNSWAERWLEKKSKDVKRLVSTSKMCTTIRNKMKKSNIRNISKKPSLYETENKNKNDFLTKTMPCEFRGSIDEYNMLTKCVVHKEEPQQPKSDNISIHQSLPSSNVSEKTKDESEETQNTTSENN